MHTASPTDPILTRFRAALGEVYWRTPGTRGPLWFSRAAKGNRIAVFLRDMPDRAAEPDRLADISTGILYNSGECIHATAYPAGSYNERTPLMQEIREDGVDL